MVFEPIYSPFSKKPRSQFFGTGGGLGGHAFLRDQLPIPMWLMLGALIQGLFNFLPYRNILLVAPVALALLFKLVTALLRAAGLLPNPWMAGVTHHRTAILYPNAHGDYASPGDAEVCAILLAARSNHPLGMFGPGFKEVGLRFRQMVKELDSDPTTFGYLGSSTWINSSDRSCGNENMVIIYFQSLEACHAYAHGKMHTDTMLWWQQNAHQMKHVGIMHEIFSAPKHASEGIYVNYHPTGLGATFTEASVEGEKVWMSPLVKGKGPLTYSKGRMGRPVNEKTEWTAFEGTLRGVDGKY